MTGRRWFLAALFSLCALFMLTGCEKKAETEEKKESYTVYYLNNAGDRLVGNEYIAEGKEELVQELLNQMTTVPMDLDCQSAIPARVERITYRIEEQVLYLYMDNNYAMMNAVQEVFCRAALTKTLTQVEGIDYLNIYCADQPIVDEMGNPVGMLSAADFVESIRDVNSFEKMELTLYFANAAGDKLVTERREVMRSTNTSPERLIVEQLMEGPKSEGAFATLPANVKLLNVSISDSVCSINFDEAFLNNTLEVREYIPIYSIVNSLAELSTVSRVQILINGSQEAVFRDLISFNTQFERNFEYVEEGETY